MKPRSRVVCANIGVARVLYGLLWGTVWPFLCAPDVLEMRVNTYGPHRELFLRLVGQQVRVREALAIRKAIRKDSGSLRDRDEVNLRKEIWSSYTSEALGEASSYCSCSSPESGDAFSTDLGDEWKNWGRSACRQRRFGRCRCYK